MAIASNNQQLEAILRHSNDRELPAKINSDIANCRRLSAIPLAFAQAAFACGLERSFTAPSPPRSAILIRYANRRSATSRPKNCRIPRHPQQAWVVCASNTASPPATARATPRALKAASDLCGTRRVPTCRLVTQHNGELLRALETIAAQMLRLDQREHDLVSFDAANFKALRAQELRMAGRDRRGQSDPNPAFPSPFRP